jgi:hypothetical protein
MTFDQIHAWCRTNGADARGIYRGREFCIRQTEDRLPADLPSLSQVFHWDLQVGERRYPTSPSDMERLVTGKMTLDAFSGTRREG